MACYLCLDKGYTEDLFDTRVPCPDCKKGKYLSSLLEYRADADELIHIATDIKEGIEEELIEKYDYEI